MSTENKTKPMTRADNPDFILSPLSCRYIRRGGSKHRQLISDQILDLDPKIRKNSIVGSGTDSEMKILRKQLKKSNLIDKSKNLQIKNGKLRTARKKLSGKQLVLGTQKTTKEAVMSVKSLFNEKRLNDKQMNMIINRIIDLKSMGKSVNIEQEIKTLLNIQDKMVVVDSNYPTHKPAAKMPVKNRKKRFNVRKPTYVQQTESEYPLTDSETE